MWTMTRVRSTWRRNAWPRPAPELAPSIRPGTSAIVGPATIVVAQVQHAQVRLQSRERVVGDLGPGGGQGRQKRGLAGVRQPHQADVGDEPQLQADPALFARLALLGVLGRLVGGGGEVDVAEAAPTAAGDHQRLTRRHEVADQLAGHVVEDAGPGRDLQDEVFARLAVLALAGCRGLPEWP